MYMDGIGIHYMHHFDLVMTISETLHLHTSAHDKFLHKVKKIFFACGWCFFCTHSSLLALVHAICQMLHLTSRQ